MSAGCTVLFNPFYSDIGLIPIVQVQYFTENEGEDV